MKLYNIHEINEFKAIVAQAKGEVWMMDEAGQEYDLKNDMGMARAIGRMIDSDLELYTSDYNTQARLERFIVNRLLGLAG